MEKYWDLFYGFAMGLAIMGFICSAFNLDWSDHNQQCVQALDKPGHIIVQVKGRNLEVSHFTPDLKVQWVSDEVQR